MNDEPRDLWTQFLDLLQQVVAPVWNDLIPLLPIAMLGFVLLVLGLIALSWRRSMAKNQSRVPPRRAGAPPPGVHLPGPSPWPFVAPIGIALVFLSLVFADGGLPVNVPLFLAGLGVGAAGVAGWYLDAGREWRRAESGAHGAGHGEATAISAGTVPQLPAWAMEPPPGVHLPGPSPWPFFAPIGIAFIFLGLIFGPVLIIGGLLMAAVAVVGWFRDAGREYRSVEAGHMPEPVSRDPEKAFPKSLVPLYGTIAALAIALTLFPVVIGLLPGSGDAAAGGDTPAESPDPAPQIAANSAVSFTKDKLVVPADTPVQLTFENQQDGVPHNVAILQGATPLFTGEIFPGPDVRTYEVPPLPAGEYTFVCTVHAPMTGTLISQ